MSKKIFGGIFGKKKPKAAPAEATGPKITPLGTDPASPVKRRPIRGPMAAASPTILSDKLGG